MNDIKQVSNNDVAEACQDKKNLDFRRQDRQIMSVQSDVPTMQTVTLRNQLLWKGDPTPSPSQSNDTLWDFSACSLPYLWTHYGCRGEGVNVFVLDTGIDQYHSAFLHCDQQHLITKSFVPGVPSSMDGCGHGTWICGKFVGQGVGICPSSRLVSLRVLDDSGTGSLEFTNQALEWILRQDTFPHIINMSLGSTKKDNRQERLIWQLYKKGACIVVAAGNDGDDEKFYPADYTGVLAVSAVDRQRTKADFSNYGGDVAVCAPGVACYSTYLGGGFRLLQGTSMASPTVAGLLSLGWSYAIGKGCPSSPDTRDLLVSALEQSADDLGTSGRDPFYGFGCIDGKGFMEKLDQKLK